jgi:hypothetical protein
MMERTIVVEYGVRGSDKIERKVIVTKPGDKVGYRVDAEKERGCLVIFVNEKTFIIPLINLALLEMSL